MGIKRFEELAGSDRPWFHDVNENDIYGELETAEYKAFVSAIVEDGLKIGGKKAERRRA